MKTERYDFFYRTENKNFDPSNTFYMILELPAGLTVGQALEMARDAGITAPQRPLAKGSHRSGCFEVQCDRGVWQHVDSKKIDVSTPRKAANVQWRTWEQIEAEELAEEAA